MKYILNLAILEVIALVDPLIEKELVELVHTTYNSTPYNLYHVLILMLFGFLTILLISQKNTFHSNKWMGVVTVIIGALNLVISLYCLLSFICILYFALILVSIYIFLGLSFFKK